MPLLVVKKIGDIKLKKTKMTLKQADKSVEQPLGVAEDVLVKIDKFPFPVYFVVMDIE